MRKVFTCMVCGHQWKAGEHGGHRCADRLSDTTIDDLRGELTVLAAENEKLKKEKAKFIIWLEESINSFTDENGTWLVSPSRIGGYQDVLDKIKEL